MASIVLAGKGGQEESKLAYGSTVPEGGDIPIRNRGEDGSRHRDNSCDTDANSASAADGGGEGECSAGDKDRVDIEHVASVHGLTENQVDELREMLRLAREEELDLTSFAASKYETAAFYCQRFLRARSFKAKDALDMLRADLRWRKEYGIKQLVQQEPADFCGCDPRLLFASLPILSYGVDMRGRPVIYKHFGDSCRISELLKHTTEDLLARFHIWQNERAVQRLRAQSDSQLRNVETWQIVIDAAGWHLGLATRGALSFLRKIAGIDSDHYPERLGRLTIINAPWVLTGTWMLIRSWLDARQQGKTNIMSGKKSWERVLQDEDDGIPKHQLPQMYGGGATVDYTNSNTGPDASKDT